MREFVVLCNPKEVQISLMLPMEYYPQMVSKIRAAGGKYAHERIVRENNADLAWVLLSDVTAGNAKGLGDIIEEFHSFTNGICDMDVSDRFYMSIATRKEKSHVLKNRKETGARGKGGVRGESSGDIRPGQSAGPDCSGTGAGSAGDVAVEREGQR